MPEQPTDAVQQGKQAGTFGIVVVRDAAGILAQNGQAHGGVEPVKHVFSFRGDQLRQRAHLLAAVGQEGDILVGLQPWLFSTPNSWRLGF